MLVEHRVASLGTDTGEGAREGAVCTSWQECARQGWTGAALQAWEGLRTRPARLLTGAALRRKPPLTHFNLDFGAAFGGSFSAKAVRLWLDPFIRETLTTMIVWPNRLVVPVLPESATGPLDDLNLRCVASAAWPRPRCPESVTGLVDNAALQW